jgi:hypothetical protein
VQDSADDLGGHAGLCVDRHAYAPVRHALLSADPGAGQPSGLRVVHLVRHGAGRPPPRQSRRPYRRRWAPLRSPSVDHAAQDETPAGRLRCGASAGCALYAPGQDLFEHVSAGQGHTGKRTPEPCAQVRILPGVLVRGINSNTLTILRGFSASAVTCGNADAYSRLATAPLVSPAATSSDTARPVAVTLSRWSAGRSYARAVRPEG